MQSEIRALRAAIRRAENYLCDHPDASAVAEELCELEATLAYLLQGEGV